MIKNFIRSFFQNKTIKKDISKNPIEVLQNISNGIGEYALCLSHEISEDTKKVKKQEIINIITKIEQEYNKEDDTDLHYALAIAYRNYCAWFIRDNERKQYLEKVIKHLKKSIEISNENIISKAELGSILIEEKVVRNLSLGIEILQELKSKNQMPDYLNSVLAKALRQSGQIKDSKSYDLCRFKDPSPAVFREERKRFRALIRDCKKSNDEEKLKQVLNQYYNLAILVTMCYKDHDCNSGVSGREYDIAIKLVQIVCRKINYSYQDNGYILESAFISDNDWKTFEKVFGNSDFGINPSQIQIKE